MRIVYLPYLSLKITHKRKDTHCFFLDLKIYTGLGFENILVIILITYILILFHIITLTP